MKHLFITLLFISSFNIFCQGNSNSTNDYPANYFNNPLKIPLVLSGTFGELRSNHFHSGLDIKTQGREGLQVFSAAEGYISRIRISHWGFGKAIYVKHPNGYTTVYAHLNNFSDKIEDYVKKEQYKIESFEIQLFPSADTLPISKNELIAYSGNTGSSGGPHLHFEIRNTETENVINPMFFGINVNDSKSPKINTLVGYSLSDDAHINNLAVPTQLSLTQLANGELLATKISAFGKIGFGINAYDQLDNAYNKNGIYSLLMKVNGETVHEFNATTFSFDESKYINLLIDYERFAKLKQRIQKCFVEPENQLSLYRKSLDNGYINIEDGLDYNVEIIAKDFKGNNQKITIPIVGKKDTILVKNEILTTPYKINYTEFNKFSLGFADVAFPKNTFYNDFYLDFSIKDSIVKVHTPTVPLDKNYTLTFDVSIYNENQKKQLYIASINDYGYSNYETTVKKDQTFYTSIKKLGNFTLLTDNKPPTISLVNFKNEQWLSSFNLLKVKISDTGSGIATYRGEIDGEWILMEFDAKKGILSYNLNDKTFTTAKHILKLTVTDNVGNTTTSTTTFFRKK